MKVVVGIPARMGASRFPGKPLAKIQGMPMVQHVYHRCEMAKHLDDLFVACCDEEIRQVVTGFGGKAFMTPPEIPRPGLRVAEACRQMKNLADDDIVVVVQGDEPFVHPGMIDLAVKPLLDDPSLQLGTMVGNANETEWLDPNEVKVVIDKYSNILFMSRAPIPTNTRNRVGPRLKQVAIMPFRKKFLLDFQEMEQMPLEIAESVELLRALEHGVRVKAIPSPYETMSVDTEKDRQDADKAMAEDPLFPSYRDRKGS
jgi:3-deoxy-manno-octulosonate cytidylyltransferase (CMP-KDO synthetase)